MIAASVFSVGALGLVGLLISSSQGMTTAEQMTHATILARDQLNNLASAPYDSIVSGEDATALSADGSAAGDDNLMAFTRVWTVTEPVAGLSYKEIEVEVQWTDGVAKRSRKVTMVGGRSK